MWILGIGFCVFGSGLNTLYTLRRPSITLSQSAIQLLAYPLGKLWEKAMPNWHFRLFRWTFHLNPGPFNQKVSVLTHPDEPVITIEPLIGKRLDLYYVQSQFLKSSERRRLDRASLLWISCWMGFPNSHHPSYLSHRIFLAGLFRSIIVEPLDMIWPGILGVTALNKVLHSPNKEDITSGFVFLISSGLEPITHPCLEKHGRCLNTPFLAWPFADRLYGIGFLILS